MLQMDSLPRILGVSHKSKYPKILSILWFRSHGRLDGRWSLDTYTKIIKPLNNLRMVEDAQIIYRVSRGRRIFYVDVGNLPKIKQNNTCDIIAQRYKNKIVYDIFNTGEVKDDRKFASILEDF